MALLQDLIQQIDDPALRERIMQETDKLVKQKKFGLVFEEHLPECTPLYDVSIRVGCKIALKTGYVSDIYTVLKIDGDTVLCDRRETHEQKTFQLSDIVAVAEFGEPIYPTLKPLDFVENAPDSDLWHTLIEADNYHALQLLEYLYAEKADCIYIDPPYNTGAKDWKYNNDYVDSSDAYRHSKWLSMMEKRLKLAKKLLQPENSTLIVTIDEKEYLHLGCLLEEMFPEAEIQMISSVINPKGSARAGRFSRVDEYIFFVFLGKSEVFPCESDMLREINEDKRSVRWAGLMRNGEGSTRARIPSLFYPIFLDKETGRFHSVGEPLKPDEDRNSVICPDGTIAMFPVSSSGQELQWRLYPPSFMKYLEKGYIRFGKRKKDATRSVSYLQDGMIKKIENGQIIIKGKNPEGDLELEYADSVGTKILPQFGIRFLIQQVNMGVHSLKIYYLGENLHIQNRYTQYMTPSDSLLKKRKKLLLLISLQDQAPRFMPLTYSIPRMVGTGAVSWLPTTRFLWTKQRCWINKVINQETLHGRRWASLAMSPGPVQFVPSKDMMYTENP